MKNFVKLNKNEMKMVVGGVDQLVGEDTYCNINCGDGSGTVTTVTSCDISNTRSMCDDISNATCICVTGEN